MSNLREAELNGTIDYTRGRGFFDPAAGGIPPVTIIGAGGIGSPTALALAKMGWPTINIADGDTVEKHNLPNQMFPLDSIGEPKVNVLYDECKRYSPSSIEPHFGFVEDKWPFVGGRASGIVILALDSIAVRKDIWHSHLRFNPNVKLVIDPRIGGQNEVIYTAQPMDWASSEAYEATLHDPKDSVQAPCTMRSIIDVGFHVASQVARIARQYVAGDEIDPMFWWDQASATRKA